MNKFLVNETHKQILCSVIFDIYTLYKNNEVYLNNLKYEFNGKIDLQRDILITENSEVYKPLN